MRHGRKSQQQRFDGYKLSAAATNTDAPLITAIDVAPACEQDGAAGQAADRRPARRSDARGGCSATPPTAPGRFAPSWPRATSRCSRRSPRRPAAGRLAKRDFHIDLAGRDGDLPGRPDRADPDRALRAASRGVRQGASAAPARCASAASRPRAAPARSLIAPDEEHLIAARQALDDPATAEHLRRTRPRIERLLGLLAHRYGARKSRYFGRRKARLQAAWTAALVNLNPIAHHLAAQTA